MTVTSLNDYKAKKEQKNNMKLYEITPDYWKKEWGEKPVLGYVRAYDAFSATRKAYDMTLLPVNFTFSAYAKEVKEQKYKKNYKPTLKSS